VANGRVPPRTPLARPMRAVAAPTAVSRPRQVLARAGPNPIGREPLTSSAPLTRTARTIPTPTRVGASRPQVLARPATAERTLGGHGARSSAILNRSAAPTARNVASTVMGARMRPVTPSRAEVVAKSPLPRIGAGQQTLSPRAESRRVTTSQNSPSTRPKVVAAATTARGTRERHASATPPQRGTSRTTPVAQGGSPRPLRVTPESRVGQAAGRPRQAMPHLGPVATRPTSASATVRPGSGGAIGRPASAGTPKPYPEWQPREVVIPERPLTVSDL
jgi:hypothetical protein